MTNTPRDVPVQVDPNDPDWLSATVPPPGSVHRFAVGGSTPLETDDAQRQDPGHLLPDDVWETVQQEAGEREQDLAELEDGDDDPARRSAAGPLTATSRTIRAYAHGGIMPGGPRLAVLHSAETPLRAGYAYSIAANWFATSRAGTSAHLMIDPAEAIRLLPDNVVAYAVGPRGNGFTWNLEQSGYASGGRRGWLSDPLGLQQMRRVATEMRELRERTGMPLRRATDAQIVAAARGELQRAGWCEHDDIRRVLGGTTHTDPGDYPWGELLDLATEKPAPPARPGRFTWKLPAGHYYGNLNGPAQSHGGYYASERDEVRNVQQWLIFRGCVTGVTASSWRTSSWADGLWETQTDRAMVEWHRRFYPGQPQPAQCWSDDYARLTK